MLLLHFFVSSMLAAFATELGELKTACSRLLVLRGGVIFVFAISTLQLHDFAGHQWNSFLSLLNSR
jgi:hypothetical protein